MNVRNQVSVIDINRSIQQRRHRQTEVFTLILERCYRRIDRCASVNRYDCMFDVPEMVVGKPLYDINKCVTFCMNHLKGNGYDVKYYFPRFLHISWSLSNNQQDARELPHPSQARAPPPPAPVLASALAPSPALMPHRSASLLDIRSHPPAAPLVRSIAEFRPSGKFVLSL